jgi:hypothetical protein
LGKFYLKTLIFNLQELIKVYSKTTKTLEKEVEFKHEDDKAYFSPFLQFPELKKFKHFNSNSASSARLRKVHQRKCLTNDPTEINQSGSTTEQENSGR